MKATEAVESLECSREGRRFHALYDKLYRRDVLQHAWEQVRRDRGAAGIDRTTIDDVEGYGVTRLLDELTADLKDGSYRPLPARRVFIPKPGTTEQRPLSIPTVRDRVVQAASKTAIEPVFEADFADYFGFRNGQHTTPCRCSSIRPGKDADGSWKRISPRAPRRFPTTGPGGDDRMPTVNDVGEPSAGEPHARFEVAGAGTERGDQRRQPDSCRERRG